jgi:hypothetical protein
VKTRAWRALGEWRDADAQLSSDRFYKATRLLDANLSTK